MTLATSNVPRRAWLVPVILGLSVFAVYSANGREIDVGDSVPTRLAARELALHGTAALDRDVAGYPEYGNWPSFVTGRDGHVRSAYSFLPAAAGAAVGGLLHVAGAIDLNAPRAASLVAKLTASLLTALAVVLAFLTARRRTSERRALLVALGFGLGTGLWPTVSQTLWQHETAIFGLMTAVWLLDRDTEEQPRLWMAGLALGLAGMARAQLTPAIALIALWAALRAGTWKRALGLWPLPACAIATAALGLAWFGHPLGPRMAMLASMPASHLVSGSISHEPWVGMFGLLFSPNRGVFVFSPVVLVALAGLAALGGKGARASRLRWFGAAATIQFLTYGSFSVWWGGYGYGPRYVLDILPLVVPFAAIGVDWCGRRRATLVLAALLLVWSIGVSAIGAFCYSSSIWNTWPDDVDERHERLWQWDDLEIARCLDAGIHADTFILFDRAAVRRPPSSR